MIIDQRRIFPCFTNIDQDPASVGEEFGPAMVAFDCAFAFVRRNWFMMVRDTGFEPVTPTVSR